MTSPTEAPAVPAARIDFSPEDRAWIAERIQEVLASGQLTLGRFGAEFERRFAALCGTEHAVAVNSGTSALEIILTVLGVKGQDVLVPTNTFFATAAAVVHAGGRPVFVDMDPETFAVDPADLATALTPRTAGLVLVHIGGMVSPRTPELRDWAQSKGLWLVEDAAQAHGSSYAGVSAGAYGIAGAFSFYPTKVITSAEGGMIVTSDRRVADEARIYRDQGKASFLQNVHVRMGYNWRLSEPHAIIGLRHLNRLAPMIADRQQAAARYRDGLADLEGLSPLPVPAAGVSSFYKYVAVLRERLDRAALKKTLRERYGVSLSGEVYEAPLHQQPVFEEYAERSLPTAEDLCARHVCLPIFSGMQEAQVDQVLRALRDTIG
jgi:dTDP-4-amino-4,6-dideoxygalactose transaminase